LAEARRPPDRLPDRPGTPWVELAELRAGESVLVHAARRRCGSAAVGWPSTWAEVFGTASPGQVDQLRQAGLDDAHLASSRTVEFEPHFFEARRGAGIVRRTDSLAGSSSNASLRLAAGASGRFVEIGKTDIRAAEQVARDHGGLAYHAFDPAGTGSRSGSRGCSPSYPTCSPGGYSDRLPVPAGTSAGPGAFRYLSQARNIGKVVLTMPAPAVAGGGNHAGHRGFGSPRRPRRPPPATGSEAGRRGADNLLLMSRRGPGAPGTAELAAELAGLGTGVRLIAADVADHDQLAASWRRTRRVPAARGRARRRGPRRRRPACPDSGPDRGRAAAQGRWRLEPAPPHTGISTWTGSCCFSSVSGLWATPGRPGTPPRNTFLDALAASRRRSGLPATSLAWGPWQVGGTSTEEGAGGMASALTEADWQRMARQGLAPHTGADGLSLLDAAATLGQACSSRPGWTCAPRATRRR